MELGRAYCRAIGLGVCGVAIAVAAFAPGADSAASSLFEVGHVAVPDVSPGPAADADGALAATVSWPHGAAGLDPTDICVVVYDTDGGVVYGLDGASHGDTVRQAPGEVPECGVQR